MVRGGKTGGPMQGEEPEQRFSHIKPHGGKGGCKIKKQFILRLICVKKWSEGKKKKAKCIWFSSEVKRSSPRTIYLIKIVHIRKRLILLFRRRVKIIFTFRFY